MTTILAVLLTLVFLALVLIWHVHVVTVAQMRERQQKHETVVMELQAKIVQQKQHIDNFARAFEAMNRPWELRLRDDQILWLGGLVLTGVQRLLDAEKKPVS